MRTLLTILVLGCFAQADQVNCIKWKDVSGVTVGTYCKPFSVRAGSGVQFADNGTGIITITSTTTTPGAAGSDTQVNYNNTGVLTGSSGLTWNYSTNTLTATHITGFSNRPYYDAVRDCGAAGDGVTDDSAAIQACFDAHPGYGFFFPQTQANGSCSYHFDSTLYPGGSGSQRANGTVIYGTGGGYIYSSSQIGGTQLCFAAGVTGFWLDNDGGILVRDISIRGSEGTNAQSAPTLLNIPSAASLPVHTRNISAIQRATQVLTVTVTASGSEGLTAQVGSTVKISGVVGDATMNGNCVVATLATTTTNPTVFTCNQNGSDSGPFGAVGTVTGSTTGASTADGIRVCGNFHKIINVSIGMFGRHGINGASSEGGCASTFSDDLVVRDSFIYNNQGFGILMRGGDANAGKFDANTFYYNGQWGAYDVSFLGNTWDANQASSNALAGASSTTPSTKNISTIARTLTSGSSQASVVLASADLNIKPGSCVVIAGVTDSSFNNTSGQCYFVNSYTDTTHYGYEQPGAPADASSSGGTSRMAKFTEAYLSSGLDYGSFKIGTSASTWSQSFNNGYSEGGQACKFGGTVPVVFGTTVPTGCAPTGGDWLGVYFQLVPGLQSFGTNLSNFSNYKDATRTLTFQAGISTGSARDFNIQYKDFTAADTWGVHVINTTAGAAGNYIITRGSAAAGTTRLAFYGPSTANGITRLDSEGTSAVQINHDHGTGGTCFGDGAGACVGTVSSAGLGTFAGVTASGTTLITTASTTVGALPTAAAGNAGAMIRVSDSTAVSAEGQTCVGSSSNNALAFSNGSVWKCF